MKVSGSLDVKFKVKTLSIFIFRHSVLQKNEGSTYSAINLPQSFVKHKTWHSKDDLCSNLSVVLCCPVSDRQTWIALPIQLFSLFEFAIIRPLLYSSSRRDNFFRCSDMWKTKWKISQLFTSPVLGSMQQASRPHAVCLSTSSRRDENFSTSCAQALQDPWQCSGSRYTLYFTAFGHLTLMISTRSKPGWYLFVIKTVIPPYLPSPSTAYII